LTGPSDSPYYNGEYHGRIIFPPEYPFKPPSIQMITPNGRFKTNTRICLSMSDFHPEYWNPSWSVASILTGLLSFMLESSSTTGSIVTSDAEKKLLASQSRKWNRESNVRFKEIFPEIHSEPVELLVNTNKEELFESVVENRNILDNEGVFNNGKSL
jgi:ubiquitin-conjugating enzyme E2 J2